jgi:hypothetical protein
MYAVLIMCMMRYDGGEEFYTVCNVNFSSCVQEGGLQITNITHSVNSRNMSRKCLPSGEYGMLGFSG